MFTILSVEKFNTYEDRRNAEADADIMRESLSTLGMEEFDCEMGKKRTIGHEKAHSHIKKFAAKLRTVTCDLAIVVISSHGTYKDNLQWVVFSDEQLVSRVFMCTYKLTFVFLYQVTE